MKIALRYGAQALLYAAFVAVIGYFSTSPAYEHLAPHEALLKLSLTHAGARKEACRQRSAEELAKLAPNMRAQSVCPRERVPVTVEVTLDDVPLFRVVAPPSGFSKDGASTAKWSRRRTATPASRTGSGRPTAALPHSAASRWWCSPESAAREVRAADSGDCLPS